LEEAVNAATFKIHGQVLGALIHLPTTAKIVDADCDYSGNVSLTVIDPDLPESHEPWPATPTVTILSNPEDYVWDWGI
jgi:hypothetical protein